MFVVSVLFVVKPEALAAFKQKARRVTKTP